MDCQVVITGAGVISPLGNSAHALHDALCAGRPAFKPVERFAATGVTQGLACELPEFDPREFLGTRNYRPLNRPAQWLTISAQLALEASGFTAAEVAEREVGLVAGTMLGGMHTIAEFDRRAMQEGPQYASALDFANTVINAAAGQAAIWHKLMGVNSTVSAGMTSGLQALAYSADLIRAGHARAILSGGVEELSFESMHGFARAGLSCNLADRPLPIPLDQRRNGFCLGEGAGLLMLEDVVSAAARKADVLGAVRGFGSRYDASRRAGPMSDEAIAQSARLLADAIHMALDEAGLTVDEIGCGFVSANGSPLDDRLEATALQLVFAERPTPLPLAAIKSLTGETLGSSPVFQVIALLETLSSGRLPGIYRLEQLEGGFPQLDARNECRAVEAVNGVVTSIGCDGHYGCLVVGSYQPDGK